MIILHFIIQRGELPQKSTFQLASYNPTLTFQLTKVAKFLFRIAPDEIFPSSPGLLTKGQCIPFRPDNSDFIPDAPSLISVVKEA